MICVRGCGFTYDHFLFARCSEIVWGDGDAEDIVSGAGVCQWRYIISLCSIVSKWSDGGVSIRFSSPSVQSDLEKIFSPLLPSVVSGNPLLSVSHLLLYILVSLHFPLSLLYSLHLLSCLSIPAHFTRIVPFHFQVRCHRRRLNLVLGFVLIFCYMYFSLTNHDTAEQYKPWKLHKNGARRLYSEIC